MRVAAPEAAVLTEPLIVSETVVSGMDMVIEGNIVRFVGWAIVPAIAGQAEERRVVERFAMEITAAQDWCRKFQHALFGSGYH